MSSRSYLLSKFRKIGAQLTFIWQALRLVWCAAPRQSALWAALLLFQGLLPVATVYLTRSLVNGLVAVVRSPAPGANSTHILLLMAAMGALILLGEVVRVSAVWLRTSQAELVQDHISGLIQRKSVAADLSFYDNADFYDHLHRARSQASDRPMALLENLGAIFQNGITLASMVVIVMEFGAWLPLALIVGTLPALYVVLRHAMDQHYWRQKVTSDERRASYYDWLLTAGETAAAIRLFGVGDHFQSAFRTLRTRLRTESLHLAAK